MKSNAGSKFLHNNNTSSSEDAFKMSDQPPPPTTATTPRQSRRGRRRRPNNDPPEEKEPDEKALLATSPGASNSSRKWTRSLSPRRLAGRNKEDADKPDASTMAQMNASFGSGLVASIKRLTGRGARSQSPRPGSLLGPLDSPVAARISQEKEEEKLKSTEKKDRGKSPKRTRSKSNPRSRSSASLFTSGNKDRPDPPSKPITRSKSDSVPRSRARHGSTSPRKSSSDDQLDRKIDATDHDSRSGRNAPLRPPSARNLRQMMDQQDQMHQSYSKKSGDNSTFMALESDSSELISLNLSPTDTIKMAAAAVSKEDAAKKNEKDQKQIKRQTSSQSSSRSSSKSRQRPRSARHMKSLNDIDDQMDRRKNAPASTRSLELSSHKPSSDPGKGNRSGTPSRRPPSFRNSRSGGKKPSSSSSSSSNKPPSVKNLAALSSHDKPSSDPGRYRGGATSSKPPRSSSNASSKSTSSSGHVPNPSNAANTADKTTTPRPVIDRPNLGKETLQHVADVKDSIRRMRTQQYSQRHKVKFNKEGTPATPVPKSKSAPPSTPSNAASIAATLQESQSTMSRQGGSGSSLSYAEPQVNTSVVRLQPGISVSDLEVGFLKSPAIGKPGLSNSNVPPSQQAAQAASMEEDQKRREKVESLMKSIKKTKKLIKRTCRDVWAERDEVVHLQRTNWSIRKALLQTDAPKDSITSLNLKIETALRQERQVSDDLEDLADEKQEIDAECSMLAKSIEDFKDLLDALNTQVVPLFPSEGEPSEEYNYEQEGTTAAAAVVQLMDDDDFDDSICSTDEL